MTTDPDLARLRISNPELARVLERCRARVAPKAQVEASEEQAELAERSGRLLSAGVPAPVREVLATGLDKTRLPVLKLAGAVLPHPPPLIVGLHLFSSRRGRYRPWPYAFLLYVRDR
jgi:hypothetical protein